MKKIHSKSSCSHAKTIRYGGRRRQCVLCKHTWRIRKKKRGRKRLRVHPNLDSTVIAKRQSLVHRSKLSKRSYGQIRLRHELNLKQILKTTRPPTAPPGPLIAVIDGWCFYPKGERHVVYLILLRPVNSNNATIMEPTIIPGWECCTRWEQVLLQLPADVRKRIKALVVDGITGVECLANEWGWVVQRCHFHQIAMLQSLRGKRWSTVKQKGLREKIYQNALTMLHTPDEEEAQRLYKETKKLLRRPDCPRWIKTRVGGFIRRLDYFRSYRKYPNLNLPTTTNAAECVFQSISEMFRLARGFRTTKSFEIWLKVQIRAMKKIKCNGKTTNQINSL